MRTESLKGRRSLKSKTQNIETSVIKFTRSKVITDTTASYSDIPAGPERSQTPLSHEPERSHAPLSRASSLPATLIERDPLPIGSDAFQAVLREITDETIDHPVPVSRDSDHNANDEQIYQPPKLKKTSSLRRTQSERIPGRSVRFGGLEIEGTPSPSPGLSFRLTSADFNI
ncbi:unnamed protein product [Mytilus edulis]|uniref:Uncharacterized protein n=1 Tax=Mytilus edulis TaxID=6550 RepID=A0A8S3SRY8_MYTED|nr:unnamed protein product [Mytilus edulis]